MTSQPNPQTSDIEFYDSLVRALQAIAECKDHTLLGGSYEEMEELAPHRRPGPELAHEIGAYKAFNQCAEIAIAALHELVEP